MKIFYIFQILFFSACLIYLFQYKSEITIKSRIGINIKENYSNDQECWKDLYIEPPNRTMEILFDKLISYKHIPTTIEEAPVGFAPSVPEEFMIEEKYFCHQKKYKIIAFVHSAIGNVENRQNIRQTWATSYEYLGTVFMVGIAKNEIEQKIVENESAKFHDIVQGKYTDLYHLLTFKALNGIYWLKKNCDHIQWVIHADDDVIFDLFLFLQKIKQLEKNNRTNEIFCNTKSMTIPQREHSKKWKISKIEFPCSTFPMYCSGAFWFSSMEVIIKLYRNIPKTKYIWIDDAYITGLLAEFSNVNRTHIAIGINGINNEIGKFVAWFNVKVNMTDHWNSIRSYYNHTNGKIE